MSCAVDNCHRRAHSRGWCERHYKRWIRHGDPEAGAAYDHEPLARRIIRFSAEDENGCWIWQLALTPAGYGMVAVDGKPRSAHRVSYLELVGPIPDGLELDHLCKVKACVNPKHLEPVTRSENVRRGWPDRRRRAESSRS